MGVLAIMAKARGWHKTWTSSREKNTAGSPESVVAGACTERGSTGEVKEPRTTWENDGATAEAWAAGSGPPHAEAMGSDCRPTVSGAGEPWRPGRQVVVEGAGGPCSLAQPGRGSAAACAESGFRGHSRDGAEEALAGWRGAAGGATEEKEEQ